ncbi:dimethyladenosine transferase 2, mitochondrial isoform X2 [Sceloporus undulatus]|uniref:dimethyladenosine transferase 2, mitochondrial isoform X2 n=1 Tax=Sceloporus undulatus TaxID=8520 RepID=UPI001C4B3FB4|nr:dimethyladenosine transferase 2, mitochondrial isoform X2 [Sceloporus undulatus]
MWKTAAMVLGAPGFSPGLRLWRRGLAEGWARGVLEVPAAGETARLVAEKTRAPPPLRRFVACPELARSVAAKLGSKGGSEGKEEEALFVECEPGPGILTRTLLNAGARVIALESNNSFLPNLESLKNKLDGQLEVVHCDFFRLDPINSGSIKPPVLYSENLFENLGISATAWTAGVPLKVVGIVPQKRERNVLWKLIYSLYERSSVYKYGRIELNLFVSEKEYKEPWSSFLTNSRNGGLSIPKSVLLQNDHLCLVRMTPRKDLFTDNLTTVNSNIFIVIVKQCLAKGKTKLIDKLNLWSCESGKKLLRQLEMPENITTGSLYPEQYKCLFELMEQSNEFDQSWLYDDDCLEDNMGINI